MEQKISETPFCASLVYRGHAFAWFFDSNLAMACANNLLEAKLIQDIRIYPCSAHGGFDIYHLHELSQWQYVQVHGHGFFICYHRSILISETRMIGAILDKTIKNYKL